MKQIHVVCSSDKMRKNCCRQLCASAEKLLIIISYMLNKYTEIPYIQQNITKPKQKYGIGIICIKRICILDTMIL